MVGLLDVAEDELDVMPAYMVVVTARSVVYPVHNCDGRSCSANEMLARIDVEVAVRHVELPGVSLQWLRYPHVTGVYVETVVVTTGTWMNELQKTKAYELADLENSARMSKSIWQSKFIRTGCEG